MAGDWTASEKKIARRAFDAALHRELSEMMRVFKAMAADASDPGDMWSTEEFLSKARREIEQKYDYRYSQLDVVFGRLLREGRILEEEIAGLSDDKMQRILHIAQL